ncbi:hypothetical protein [Pseudaestuariivita sp.]|uniref:hypothetical protein n=1 Tax=Pseudaestuariivita sp. TaxID=2211669 RepID=UPI004057D3DF
MFMGSITKDETATAEFATNWAGAQGVDTQSTEEAVALRSVLLPVFHAASDWPELQKKLAQKGFGLSFQKGRMVLTDIATGMAICTGRFLGTPLKEISARLGRPSIVALPGGTRGAFSL